MKVQMFKNCKIDNTKNVSSFSTVEAQNSYYEGLITTGNGFEKDVNNFNKLGEPFLINYNYSDIIEYNYGRFLFGNKWYYFSVEDLEVTTNGKTKVIYQIDAWETARLQFGASLGAGTLNRKSGIISGHMPLPSELEPTGKIYTRDKRFNSTNAKSIYISYHKSDTDVTTAFLYKVNNADIYSIREGTWIVGFLQELKKCWIPDAVRSDIIGAWLMPYSNHGNTTIWEKSKKDSEYTSDCLYEFVMNNSGATAFSTDSISLGVELYSDDTCKRSITDLRGNIIFTPYPDKFYTGNEYLKLLLDPSVTNPSYTCWISSNPSSGDTAKKQESLFTLPFEPLDVMGDNYEEYFIRQRESDIQSRKLGYERQLVEGITGAGQGAIGGAIAGGMSGASGIGALAGFGMNLTSSLGQYALNQHYDPKEQAIIDRKYKNSKDELVFVGSKMQSILNGTTDFSIVSESIDVKSQNRYNNYISTFGYRYNIADIDCSKYYTTGYLSGDFEIKGNIPNIWKSQISNRFKNGVRVIE